MGSLCVPTSIHCIEEAYLIGRFFEIQPNIILSPLLVSFLNCVDWELSVQGFYIEVFAGRLIMFPGDRCCMQWLLKVLFQFFLPLHVYMTIELRVY